MKEIKLSILIPTLESRTEFRNRLLDTLKPQIISKTIELCMSFDVNKTIGEKRNKLISMARGEYCVFIDDDDDRVSPDYIDQLFVGINKKVDAVCVQQIITIDGKNPKLVIDCPYQKNDFKGNVYYRGAQHLDSIKREIANKIQFTDKSFGEDKDYTDALHESGLIKTWHLVPKPIYYYEYRTNKGGK